MATQYSLSPSDLAFNNALNVAKKSFEKVPDGESLVDKIESKFRSIFDNPFLEEFQDLVSMDTGLEEARMMLFKPEGKDVPVLVKLFQDVRFGAATCSSSGQTQSPLQIRLKATLLTLIYLVHRKNWSFLREFICQGGLIELTHLLLEENLYLRGQVVEILLTSIDCDTFDWFQFKDLDEISTSLHKSLLRAIKQPHFFIFLCMNQSSYHTKFEKEIVNFVRSAESKTKRIETFPGGSMLSLQIFGFALSWVRALSFEEQARKENSGSSSSSSSSAGGNDNSLNFIACSKFEEKKEGFYFGLGKQGLGYYEDARPDLTSSGKVGGGSASQTSDIKFTPLHLHVYLFEQIQNWLDSSKPDDITIEDIVDNTLSEEKKSSPEYFECKLAKTILDDFSSNSAVVHEETIQELIIGLNTMSISDASPVKKEVIAPNEKNVEKSPSSSSSSSNEAGSSKKGGFKVNLESITSVKESANKYYNENKLPEALNEYNEAIEMLEKFKADDDSLFEEKGDARQKRLEVECSLHYNKATVFWKIYKMDSTSDKGLESLRNCEAACRRSLEIKNEYDKSLYRLVNVLYIFKQFKECISIIEAVLSRANKTGVALSESSKNSMQAFRNFLYKCKAAEIIRLDFDILKSDSGPTSNDVTSDHSSTSASSTSSTQISQIAPLVNPDALKVLKALQKRQVRESQRVNHAYYSENPNNHVVESSINASVTVSSSSAGGLAPHEIDLSTSNSVGDIFDIIKSAEEKEKEEKKSSSATSKASKVKDKDAKDGKEKSSKKASEYLLKLADGSKEYSRYYSSRGKTAIDRDALSAKTFDTFCSIWKRDFQLKDVVGASLSEYLVVLTLDLVLFLSRNRGGEDASNIEAARRVYAELVACQRFESVVNMAVMTSDSDSDVGFGIQASIATIKTSVLES